MLKKQIYLHILTSPFLILQGSVFCMFRFVFNLRMALVVMPCLAYTDWNVFSTCSFLFANKPSCWGALKITQLQKTILNTFSCLPLLP